MNCLIENTSPAVNGSSGAGLRLLEGSSSVTCENNRFEDNVLGVHLGLNTSFSDTTSTFSNNSVAQVAVGHQGHVFHGSRMAGQVHGLR